MTFLKLKLYLSIFLLSIMYFITVLGEESPSLVNPDHGNFKRWGCCRGSTGPTGPTGPPGSIGVGIERVNTNNGTFVKDGRDFIWTSNGGSNTNPHFDTTTDIWAPFGSATSYITVVPGGLNTPDYFVCSKNIRTLRFYTEIQVSVASTSRWRTNLFLNGVPASPAQFWGAPPNNTTNTRVFGVLEYGGIPAGTEITVKIEANSLPTSTQNNASYFVVEYEL